MIWWYIGRTVRGTYFVRFLVRVKVVGRRRGVGRIGGGGCWSGWRSGTFDELDYLERLFVVDVIVEEEVRGGVSDGGKHGRAGENYYSGRGI